MTTAASVQKAIKLGNIKGVFVLVTYASEILAGGGGAGAESPGATGGGGAGGPGVGPAVGAAAAGAGAGELVLATLRLRAVASGARNAVRSVDEAGVEDALTPVCRSLVSLGVLAGPVTLDASG